MSDEEFLRHVAAIERRRRRKVFRIGCGIVLLLILLVIVAALIHGLYWKHALRAEIARLRADGQPVTWTDVLAARESIPDDENSALIFRNACTLMPDGDGVIRLAEGPLGRMPSDDARRLIAAWVAARGEALAKVHEAAALERGSWPIAWIDNPRDVDPGDVDDAHLLSDVCRIEALQRAVDGDVPGAVRSLVACRRLAAALGNEPVYWMSLHRTAVSYRTVDGIESVLGLRELAPEMLRRLRDELAVEERRDCFQRPFLGERASSLWLFTCPRRELADVLGPSGGSEYEGIFRVYTRVPGLRDRDGVFFLRVVNQYVDAAALPERQMLATCRTIESGPELAALRQGYWHLGAWYCVPAGSRMVEGGLVGRVNLRVARAALAVEEYRLARGQWPASVDELVPDFLDSVPEDPFAVSGPLSLKRTADGLRVLSFGQDGLDNGGTMEHEAAEQAGGRWRAAGFDIVFRLLDPDKRAAPPIGFAEEVADALGLVPPRRPAPGAGVREMIAAFVEGGLNDFECDRLIELGLTRKEMVGLGYSDEELRYWPAEDGDGDDNEREPQMDADERRQNDND